MSLRELTDVLTALLFYNLLCAEDGHRVVYQIPLERNGVTINGKLLKLIAYPEGIHHLESITKSDPSVVYFAAAKSPYCNGGLYCFDR